MRYSTLRRPAFFFLLSCLLTVTLAASPAKAAEPAASVVSLRGQVTAINAAGVERPLAIKDQLFVSDTIKTGPNGRLQVLFTDNTIVSLGTKAEMAISEYEWQPEQPAGAVLKTRVEEGAFRVMGGALAKAAPERFTTETPSATIGIRGSMYAGKVSDGALAVVFQGGTGIFVQNAAGIVEITEPGFGTKVESPDTAPTEPVAFSEEELSGLENGTAEGEGEGEGEGAAGEEKKEEGAAEEQPAEEQPAEEQPAQGETAPAEEQPTATEDTSGEWADTTFDEPPPTTDPFTTTTTTDTTVDTGEVTTTSSQDTVTQEAEDTADSTTSSQDTVTQEAEDTADSTTTSLSGRGIMTLHDKVDNDELYYRYGSSSASRDSDGVTTVTVAGYQLPFTFNWSTSGTAYSGLPASVEVAYGTAYSLNIDGQIFDNYYRYLYADNLGEFFYLKLYDMIMQDFEHESLVYAGIASTAGQMPTTGVDNYKGHLGGKSIPISPATNYDGFVESADLEVNWANKKFIGVTHDDDHSSVERQNAVFFFGDLTSDRNTASNITVIGRDSNWGGDDLKSATIYSTTLSGGFYGSEYQGFGGYGAGGSYSAYTTTQTENWDIATAMFRDPADHQSSPAGSISAQGFIVGVAKGFGFGDGTTATTPLVFSNPAPEGLQVTLDQTNGRVSGTASASGSDGAWSLQNISVGHATDNAYSAYVTDDNFIALLNTTSGVDHEGTTGSFKPNQNFIVTAEPTDTYVVAADHKQFSDHVTWGYWAVAFEDPLDPGTTGVHYDINPQNAYWIAGVRTPQDYLDTAYTNYYEGTYTGPAYGSHIDITAKTVTAMTNGATTMNVNFNTRYISGSIIFDQASIALVNGNFSTTGNFNITGGDAFTVNTVTASHGEMSGAFFGNQAQALAGSFDVTAHDTNNRYVGIYGGNGTPAAPN